MDLPYRHGSQGSNNINNRGSHRSSTGDDNISIRVCKGNSLLCLKVLHDGFYVALENVHFPLELGHSFLDNNVIIFKVSHEHAFVSFGIISVTSRRNCCGKMIR